MIKTIALLCFFLSGFAGLVYEICWIRQAALVFGSTIEAFSTVLATFFAGLALGSYLFAGIAQRLRRPLRLYAILEVVLAALALASPLAFEVAETLYGMAYRSFETSPGVLAAVRVAYISLVLLGPTVLMGGTLPLFCRQFVDQRSKIAGSVGFLYGINTLGAAMGCTATGVFLLPGLGLTGAIQLGSALSLIAGIGVAVLPLAVQVAEPAVRPAAALRAAPQGLVVGALFFTTGLIALASEVVWTRFLALLIRNTVYTYTISLSVVLGGIVLGSLLASRLFDRALPLAGWFGAIQVLSALATLTLVLLPTAWWSQFTHDVSVCIALMAIPAIGSGALFPLAIRMVVADPLFAGVRVGRMAALNMAGGIIGSLAAGFLGLAMLGLAPTLKIITAIGVASGCFAWLYLGNGSQRWRIAAALVAIALWLALPPSLATRIPADFLAARDRLVDYREGALSNLAVVRSEGVLQLEIDRWWQGENRKNHQIMAAHLPVIAHPDPRRVLVVGVGTGQTAARFLMHDIDYLDCIDIEPAIFDLLAAHFDAAWMQDPRTRLIREDGRSYLTHGSATYDVISLEVGQLFRPGIANFYTADFYDLAARRLNPGGVIVQFVPLPFLAVEEFRRVLASFLAVFPQSMLWYNTSELLLLGVNAERIAIDLARVERRLAATPVHADLSYSYWNGPSHWLHRPEVFLGGFLCGPRGLSSLSGDAAPYRDDIPHLEYAADPGQVPANPYEIPIAELLHKAAQPVGSVLEGKLGTRAGQIRMIQVQNTRDLIASAHLRMVEQTKERLQPQQMIRAVDKALRLNPQNAQGHRMMADALVLAGRLEDAERSFAQALAIRRDDALSHRGMAFVLARSGRNAEAIAHLREALGERPEDAIAHNYLGVALAQEGDLDGAIRHFRRALEIQPRDAGAQANLARAAQRQRAR